MKENKKSYILLIFTILFFIIVNAVSWLVYLGVFGDFYFIATLLLIIIFMTLAITLFVEIGLSIAERSRNKKKNLNLIITTALLTLTVLFPKGVVIPASFFEASDNIVAYREGVANCGLTIKLKNNGSFLITEVCFGISKYTGDYTLKRDSIFFHYKRERRDGIHYGVLLKGQDSIGNNIYQELLTYDIDTNKSPLHFAITEYNSEE